jgi:hypothetical protein
MHGANRMCDHESDIDGCNYCHARCLALASTYDPLEVIKVALRRPVCENEIQDHEQYEWLAEAREPMPAVASDLGVAVHRLPPGYWLSGPSYGRSDGQGEDVGPQR